MDGLPRDTHGNRGPGEDVVVGIFTGQARLVQALMDELVAWLRRPSRTAPLVRSALLHLNVIAIHPFRDGTGDRPDPGRDGLLSTASGRPS